MGFLDTLFTRLNYEPQCILPIWYKTEYCHYEFNLRTDTALHMYLTITSMEQLCDLVPKQFPP